MNDERVLIVGSGPAAVGAALACLRHPRARVTVLDVGGRLEGAKAEALARVAGRAAREWAPEDVEAIVRNPVESTARGLPRKRSYGSDYPFRDFGQRGGLDVARALNHELVSGAYGGFSNVWGAQAMPFTAASFGDWPVAAGDMAAHYEAILRAIPFAGEHDDLARLFPLYADGQALPPLSARSDDVLARYRAHRAGLNARGVYLGRARLALDAAACTRCGLCLTGCPESLIYSAAHTMEKLRRTGLDYRGGRLVTRLEETPGGVAVTARVLADGSTERIEADRVFVACGAIGSSRLVMGSLGIRGPLPVLESAQFVLPFASARPVGDPREASDFTLNQFNLVVQLDAQAREVSQLHFYTYNSAFLEALPAVLGHARLGRAQTAALRRLSVAFGYLPSWASPRFSIEARPARAPDELPELEVREREGEPSWLRNRMLRRVLGRVAGSARALDLWPLLPALTLPAPGKSYHFGGTFAHSRTPGPRAGSDVLGRVAPWRRVHLVDASVFPTIPATTFTLSIMANAHRIADTALGEGA